MKQIEMEHQNEKPRLQRNRTMAKRFPRSYKYYLRSCRVEDVSPRIMRRLNFKPKVRPNRLTCKDSIEDVQYVAENMDMGNINKSHEDTVTMQEAIMENMNEIADTSIDVNEAQNVCTERGAGTIEAEAFKICEKLITEDTNNIQQDAIDFDDVLNVENIKGNDINVASDPENKMIYTGDQVSEWDSDLLVIFNDLTDDKNDHQHDICRTRTLQEFMSHEEFLSDIEIPVNKSRVARAPMQGVTLFNGKYGCNWCLHPGEWYEGSNRYPILEHTVEERNMKNMIKFMMEIADKECADVYGLKSISPLINLPYFDVCKGFVPDYMHCCLAGVGKQITNKFLELLPTSKIEELNKILLNVKVPHQLGRLSRSFADISDWKAKEWENFILYYSLPLFRYALPQRFVKYWSLFVESLYTLLKCDISLDELNKADEDLHKFVFLTQELFSKKAMTFNIHQLIHISESVLNWGPLWSHSTFPFESANKDILQAIHCAKGVNLQIVRYVHMQQTLHTLRHRIYPHASPLVINYCEQLTVKRIKKSCKVSSITYLGGGKFIDENIAQNFGMSAKCTLAYQRAIIDGCLVSSKQNNKRSDNSFAILTDNTFIRILDFLVDNENNKEITLCNIVNTSNRICNFLSMVRNIGNETIAIQTKQIVQVCVFIEILEECYIATLPNIYHY
ncbi:uncharacterized protein [Temnothorax nylanderi]|uniref:uncharacterized protein isoform X3 n=1 Tax=Temnothorax nylanderi TaxID=102681 RepID=UPI003A83F1BA